MPKNVEDELIEMIDSFLEGPKVSLKDIKDAIKMVKNENTKRQLDILLYRLIMLNLKIGAVIANSLAQDEQVNRWIYAVDEFRQELAMVAKELELDEMFLEDTTKVFKHFKKHDPDGAIIVDSLLCAIETKEEMLEMRVSAAVDMTVSHSNGINVYLPDYEENSPKEHNDAIRRTLTTIKKENNIK